MKIGQLIFVYYFVLIFLGGAYTSMPWGNAASYLVGATSCLAILIVYWTRRKFRMPSCKLIMRSITYLHFEQWELADSQAREEGATEFADHVPGALALFALLLYGLWWLSVALLMMTYAVTDDRVDISSYYNRTYDANVCDGKVIQTSFDCSGLEHEVGKDLTHAAGTFLAIQQLLNILMWLLLTPCLLVEMSLHKLHWVCTSECTPYASYWCYSTLALSGQQLLLHHFEGLSNWRKFQYFPGQWTEIESVACCSLSSLNCFI